MLILVAEDDVRLRDVLEQALTESGWDVVAVGDGQAALDRATADPRPDVLLLDLGLPLLDGLEVCRQVRASGAHTPTLMLTARGEIPQRVEGLDAGADDYLAKPFELEELLARLRALLRRERMRSQRSVTVGELVLDPRTRTATKRGEVIDLTAKEFDVVSMLARRAGRVVTRAAIVAEVWGQGVDLRSNVMDVHMATIRAKVDRAFGTATIATVRGVGYRLDAG